MTGPEVSDKLFDRFEGVLVAMRTDAATAKAGVFCSSENGLGDCRECRAFVNARMKD